MIQKNNLNLGMETETWKSHLTYTYDAVKYLWTVHNSVNERLKKEDNNDPSYPKSVFPSRDQCPKCYKANFENLKIGEDPFVKSELMMMKMMLFIF